MPSEEVSSAKVTVQMIQAVREHECSLLGHRWYIIEEVGNTLPVRVYCSNCGVDSGLVPNL